jgi:sialate O-acetylesterase
LAFSGNSSTSISSSIPDDSLWNGKRAAVVLTYDDGLNVHLDNAIPLLDSLQLKATFYVSSYPGALDKRMAEWRKAANNGHELGNHTIIHPCLGNIPGRDWVQPEFDMSRYTPARMVSEIRTANMLLKAIDNKTHRTFAYTCGDKFIDGVEYLNPIKNEFTGARGVNQGMHSKTDVDLFDIKCYSTNGQDGKEVISWVKEAIEKKKLLVFLIHGVGGEHSLNLSLEAHRELLHFLKTNEKEIWVTTMTGMAEYLSK